MEAITVTTSKTTYSIWFVDDLSPKVGELKSQTEKHALLTDTHVSAAQAELLEKLFPVFPRLVLPAGEATKSLVQFGHVLDFLAAQRLDRHSLLWGLGGGVVGDLGGVVAASYLRGIDFVQVPTTLLAMVDSSSGGKTGINLAAGKNLVGAFHYPRAVLISTNFLVTLPLREFASGVAEVIKYGLLGDAALFAELEATALTPRSASLLGIIRRCCEIKVAIVKADEFETATDGGRALLNLGHTFGHAIEQVAGYGAYLHGEAVAIGLVAAARLSERLGYLRSGDVVRVERAVALYSLPARLREPLAVSDLLKTMQHDKKVRLGQLRFVVLKRLGEAAIQAGVDVGLVGEIWREIGAR